MTILHGNPMSPWKPPMPTVCVKRTKHAHRHHRRIRLNDRETDSGSSGLKLSISGASSFRKEEDGTALKQPTEDSLQTRASPTLPIHWHSLPASQGRPYPGKPKQS